MASTETTLTSLWVDDGAGGVIKAEPITPSKISGSGLKDEVLQHYTRTGLEPVARQAGLLDSKGELTGFTTTENQGKSVQIIQMMSPMKGSVVHKGQLVATHSPVLLGAQKRITQAQSLVHTPKGAQYITTPLEFRSPRIHQPAGVKRNMEFGDYDYPEGKRKKEKGGKGLRHFSMKVCEKVQRKGTTSYNEVADELVQEFSDPRHIMSPADQQYDQKNIRRRVYDALNVLMAMNIISKEKKEIKWIGLPTNSAQECSNLEVEKQRRLERIKHKTQQLQELILQQIAYKNLVERNKETMRTQGAPAANSAIQLPFIIVNTSKKTVINCNISSDKYNYVFNFDNAFEIHDDIEVLKRMGMAFGLEKNSCSAENLRRAVKMVPRSLEPYVVELAQNKPHSGQSVSRSILSTAGPSRCDGTDQEVAQATQGLSRQSSLYTPDEDFSVDSESDRSSPV